MSESQSSALVRAFELVEAGRPDEARALLEPVLAEQPNNADAWWVYAYAVPEPADARRALRNVLRINANYPGAQQLLSTLEEQYPAEVPVIQPLSTTASAPEPVEEVAAAPVRSTAETVRPAQPVRTTTPRATPPVRTVQERRDNRLPTWLVIAGLALLVMLCIVFILPSITNQPVAATATLIAANPTLETVTNTSVPLIVETELVAETEIATEPSLEPTEAIALIIGSPTVETQEETATIVLPTATDILEEPTTVVPTPTLTVIAETPTTENAEANPTNDPGRVTNPTDSAVVLLDVTPLEATSVTSPTQEVAVQVTLNPTAILVTLVPITITTPVTTSTSAAQSVEETVTPEATADPLTLLTGALAGLPVPANGVEEIDTELGRTVVVTLCTTEGPELRAFLPQVMDVTANNVASLDSEIAAIGARLVNCANQRTLRLIVAPREAATDYAASELTEAEFEASWQSL